MLNEEMSIRAPIDSHIVELNFRDLDSPSEAELTRQAMTHPTPALCFWRRFQDYVQLHPSPPSDTLRTAVMNMKAQCSTQVNTPAVPAIAQVRESPADAPATPQDNSADVAMAQRCGNRSFDVWLREWTKSNNGPATEEIRKSKLSQAIKSCREALGLSTVAP